MDLRNELVGRPRTNPEGTFVKQRLLPRQNKQSASSAIRSLFSQLLYVCTWHGGNYLGLMKAKQSGNFLVKR